MATPAFEQIISRMALPTSAVVEKYDAAGIDSNGLIAKATATNTFLGIVQYGAKTIGDIATVVQGIFPAKVSADVVKGARLKISATAGKFVTAESTDDAVAIALMDIDADAIGSVLMIPSAGAAA